MPLSEINSPSAFTKWSLGIFTVMLMGLGTWTFNTGTSNARDIAVIQEKQNRSDAERVELRQDVRDLKLQLDRMESEQRSQAQVQTFILQNMVKKK